MLKFNFEINSIGLIILSRKAYSKALKHCAFTNLKMPNYLQRNLLEKVIEAYLLLADEKQQKEFWDNL